NKPSTLKRALIPFPVSFIRLCLSAWEFIPRWTFGLIENGASYQLYGIFVEVLHNLERCTTCLKDIAILIESHDQ
ncbi:MAG: hypothetical protein QNJ47_28875, partial [Nostocaceae cyanobacterium]|nr:hypothetical protein [Nostocaceae cyanobacterium]